MAPTDAGEQLLAELRPALTGIRGALHRIGGLRNTPRGRLRLLIPRLAAMAVLGSQLGRFARNYPDVVLDVSTDEARLDLVAGGFDAGVQYGEFIQNDMVAVRVSADHRPAIVASPAYFADHPKPHIPHDLLQHRCINYRHGSGEIYRWELDKGDQSVAVAVNGPLITNDVGLLTRAALEGRRKSASRPSLIFLVNPSPNSLSQLNELAAIGSREAVLACLRDNPGDSLVNPEAVRIKLQNCSLHLRRNERVSLVRQTISNDLTLTEL